MSSMTTKNRSPCCEAEIFGSLGDGVLIGTCSFCHKDVSRVNPRTGDGEWLDGQSPYTRLDDLRKMDPPFSDPSPVSDPPPVSDLSDGPVAPTITSVFKDAADISVETVEAIASRMSRLHPIEAVAREIHDLQVTIKALTVLVVSLTDLSMELRLSLEQAQRQILENKRNGSWPSEYKR